MSSLTRRFAAPTAATLAIVCVIGTAVIASAQLLSELGPDICRAPASEVAAEASFLAEHVLQEQGVGIQRLLLNLRQAKRLRLSQRGVFRAA